MTEIQQLFYDEKPQRFRQVFRKTAVDSRLESDAIAQLNHSLTDMFGCDAWDSQVLNYPRICFNDGRYRHAPDLTIDFEASYRGADFKAIVRGDGFGLLHLAVKPSTYPHLDREFEQLHAVRRTNPFADLALYVGHWTGNGYHCTFERICLSEHGCDTCCPQTLFELAAA